MRRSLLVTVAAAGLIAGLTAASAQIGRTDSPAGSPGASEQRKGGAAMERSTQAPALQGKGGAQLQGQGDAQLSPSNRSTTGQGGSDDSMPRAGQRDRAPNAAQNDQRGTSGQGQRNEVQRGDDTKAGAGSKMGQDSKSGSDSKMGQDSKSGQKMGQDSKSGQGGNQAGQQRDRTTGQGVAPAGRTGAAVQVNETQRTKIKQTINVQSAPKVTNVNFSISVGTRVPQTVRLAPLPATVVAIVPEYRGYLYFVVEERIIIVEPDTHEIVLIIT
jgi:hypothetical protein